jgi:hypothetical protein
MEHLGINHLSKWNSQNKLIIQQTCVKEAKVLATIQRPDWNVIYDFNNTYHLDPTLGR